MSRHKTVILTCNLFQMEHTVPTSSADTGTTELLENINSTSTILALNEDVLLYLFSILPPTDILTLKLVRTYFKPAASSTPSGMSRIHVH